MHRRPRLSTVDLRQATPTRTDALAAVITAVALLAACSAPVQVGEPDDATSPACAELRWPQSVGGHGRVITSPREGWVAAWGKPAIIARCGIPALEPTSLECVEVDGIDWIVLELEGGTAMSTYGTDPALEVIVPEAYGPGPLLLPAFTEVAATLPQTDLGCDLAD